MFEFFAILFLIVSCAFLAISELSLLASKKPRLQAMVDDNIKNAALALKLSNRPNRIIATAQISLTLITLIEGAFTESLLSPEILPFISQYNVLVPFSHFISVLLSFLIVTSLTILFGDIIPKRLAIIYPEQIAVKLAPVMNNLVFILGPLVNIFSFLSDKMLTMFGVPIENNKQVSAEDIEDIFEAGRMSGLLDETEKNLLDNVWSMDERKVGALMTPRSDIIYIDIMWSNEDNLKLILDNPSKRILVCNDGLDHVLGFGSATVWLKNIMQQLKNGDVNPKVNWENNLSPIHIIPNTLSLIETLESFRKFKAHVALVYNEFGSVEGIISMYDLMSAVVGEHPSTLAEDVLILKDDSGKWLIDGMAPIDEVKKALDIETLPYEDSGNTYHTAAGFVLAMLGRTHGRLAKEFDRFTVDNYIFEVVDIDRSQGYKIDQIMVMIDNLSTTIVNEDPKQQSISH